MAVLEKMCYNGRLSQGVLYALKQYPTGSVSSRAERGNVKGTLWSASTSYASYQLIL